MATGALLERAEPLAELAAAMADALAGTGRVVLVSGEAGIGKTSLVRAFLAALPATVRVLAGACDDLLAPRALGPLHDSARGTGGPLEQALATSPDAVFGAVIAQLAPAPTLLVIEDLHWADDATLDVLRYLARRIDALPAVLLLTVRYDDVVTGHPVQQFLGALAGTHTTRLPLAPLSAAAVMALAGAAGRDGEAVFAATAGNPFYVTETLAAPPDETPATVADAVRARVGRLGPATVSALEQLSVVPNRVDLPLARAVLGDRFGELVEAEERGILEVRDDGVAFRHELARRAVASDMPRVRSRALHRVVLAALRAGAMGVDLERVVHHAVQAGDGATTAEFAPRAGRAALRAGSHSQALAYFTAAAAHLDRLPPADRARLLRDLAWELHIAHRFVEAVATGQEAVRHYEQLGDPVALGEATVQLSRISFMAGDSDEGLRLVAQAIDVLSGSGSPRELAAATTDLGALLVLTGRLADAVEPLRRALAMAIDVGRSDLEALCLIYLGLTRTPDDVAEGVAGIRKAIAVAVATGSHEPAARAHVNLGDVLYSLGDWAGFRENFLAGSTYAGEHGLWKDAFLLEVHHCLLMVHDGEWERAAQAFDELQERKPANSMFDAEVLSAHGRLLTRIGRADAGAMVERAWRQALQMRLPLGMAHSGRARVEWAWLHGEPAAAREVADVLLPRMTAPGWAHLRGELTRYLARVGVPVEPFDGCPEGFAAGLRGDWQAAAAYWERAGDRYEQALELAGSGDVTATLAGLQILDGLGATVPATLTRLRLRELGLTRVPRGPSVRTRSNPAGLTDRQLDVLERLKAGDTNPEIAARLILSVRTVDHHVAAILTKLGVRSRREAVAVARDREAGRPRS